MTTCASDLVVGNERGIHGRVATRLAEVASEFAVVLQIRRAEETVECSSILDVLSLALVQGSEISVQAVGEQAEAAMAAAAELITAQEDP
ncbi:HPr family phosphocarrier protein [Desulfobulbus sp.]|uniref:HPr family phosphocarrier protein n=1 Tax=Desulfobulbus sp. TaxID=895 RepID=UPI0027B912EE|nr:HPr family phosphocarrier protein [Desulfobulbus sp.]